MKVENFNVKRIKFRDDITALRALAVISVLLYHAEFQLFKGGWLEWSAANYPSESIE